eukprot:TRINITY_DN4379_c0_g1_i1.p1 TRINITY_DN4379_c0_g1~~TRINITY_DN4379_c0_g1_i1.p1  ORF type:complete len:363 (-),score=69.27 TRINITY_DN4379_c0_g1_i1:333-1421(-)
MMDQEISDSIGIDSVLCEALICSCLSLSPGSVLSYRLDPFDTSGVGFVSTLFYLGVDYTEGVDDKFNRMVLKWNPAHDFVIKLFGIAEREVKANNLYSSWDLDCIVQCYGSYYSEEFGSLLFLEDLTAGSLSFGIKEEASSDFIFQSLNVLAKFHAKTLVKSSGELRSKPYDWLLDTFDDEIFEVLKGLYDVSDSYIEEIFGENIFGDDLIVLQGTDLRDLLCIQNTQLCSLLHGDAFISNFIEVQRGSQRTIVMLDFQFAAWGSPLEDVALLIQSSTDPKERHMNEMMWIQYYWNTLKEEGTDLDFDTVLSEYRLCKARALATMLISVDCYRNQDDPEKHNKLTQRIKSALREGLNSLSQQ